MPNKEITLKERYVLVPVPDNDNGFPRIVLVDRLERIEYRFLDTQREEHRAQFHAWLIEQVHTHGYGYLSRPIGTYQDQEI